MLLLDINSPRVINRGGGEVTEWEILDPVNTSVPCSQDQDDDGEGDVCQDDDDALQFPSFCARSLRRMTRDALPQIDFYRNTVAFTRPDLDELHAGVFFHKQVRSTYFLSAPFNSYYPLLKWVLPFLHVPVSRFDFIICLHR